MIRLKVLEQLQNIRKKYGFDQSLTTQYFYYLNDVSPLSLHSNKKEDYTFLSHGKYSYKTLFRIGESTLVLKYPYLRESFQKNGKKVSEIITETLPNTAILALFAISIAISIGIFFGILSVTVGNIASYFFNASQKSFVLSAISLLLNVTS